METLICICKNNLLNLGYPLKLPVRYVKSFARSQVRRQTGTPPHEGKSIQQKLQDVNYKDPSVYYKVDIGFPRDSQHVVPSSEKTAYLKKIKQDIELEKKARKNELIVNLREVYDEWAKESGPAQIKSAAEHYGVFQDLFGDAFFYPQVSLDVSFKVKEGLLPVCRGNLLKPSQALSAPEISFQSDPDSLWTLVVTNPDGNLLKENSECLHWLIGNIPGNAVHKGEVVADYIQPFPARGTGFQRFIFTLYKQTEKIDYSALKIPSNEVNLDKRIFSTYDFYQPRQDHLTPAGLAFCQVDWDHSVSNFFHTVLNTDEPVFEYDFAPHYYTPQRLFPIKQAFNLYMDRYRDPKQIAKEFLMRKLEKRNPFERPKPPLKYPNAVRVYHDLNERIYGKIPSWLKREKLKSRLGFGRINEY
ncbi:39S ribosomal protein L38, mitochondrial [Macrosteles quadrilineatus]|uniref:39S ribosomal protein L38, mitochondrial n=1 Tax=Macrosteles quadrilineatus TaxID=74068 RepID=UPI0023E2BF4D|nr:39S ribosomal protein L38, mitochondrial [Macrosteles quadrilineatus]